MVSAAKTKKINLIAANKAEIGEIPWGDTSSKKKAARFPDATRAAQTRPKSLPRGKK